MKRCQEESSVNCLASIGGKVITSDGKPIAEARVMISDGPSYIDIAALTNNDGVFRFDNLCSGTYKISICADNYESKTVTFSVEDKEFLEQEIQVTTLE